MSSIAAAGRFGQSMQDAFWLAAATEHLDDKTMLSGQDHSLKRILRAYVTEQIRKLMMKRLQCASRSADALQSHNCCLAAGQAV